MRSLMPFCEPAKPPLTTPMHHRPYDISVQHPVGQLDTGHITLVGSSNLANPRADATASITLIPDTSPPSAHIPHRF